MSNQCCKNLKVNCDNLEWLYIANVVYAEYGEVRRHLQLIVPSGPNLAADKRFPLILYVPGSAWYEQEVYNGIPSLVRLAERGFVIAELQYRESTIAHFPAQIQDAKAALRFMVKRAGEFHVDTDNIFVAGDSSGAHTALMTALTKAHNEFDAELYPDVDYDIKGVIAKYPPTDLNRTASEPIPEYFPEGFNPERDFLGISKVEDNPELVKAASCPKYVTKEVDLPPVLLMHGTADDVVSIENSRDLYRLLGECDKEVCYYEIEGAGHGGAVFWTKEILDIIEQFIKGI